MPFSENVRKELNQKVRFIHNNIRYNRKRLGNIEMNMMMLEENS